MKQRTHAIVSSQTPARKSAGLLGMVIVFAAGLMLSACNTTAGAGQDISATGRDITKGAVDVKNKL